MKELKSYYLRRLAILSVGLALLLLSLERAGLAVSSDVSTWHSLGLGLISGPAGVIYLVLGERLIRKTLWKLEKPALNFQGTWRGRVAYQAGHAAPSFVAGHLLCIEQDCLSFRIAPATPQEVTWGPLALDMIKDTLRYAYWVDYGKSDPAKFPESAKGYAEMRVIGYDDQKKPQTLTGTFWHFAQAEGSEFQGDDSLVFQGTISLCRESP